MPTRYTYPVTVDAESDGVTVTFPDLPEAITGAPTRAAALTAAVDCLEEALAARIVRRLDIPRPGPARGRPVVAPGTLIAAKTALYEAMRESGTSNTALAEALGIQEGEVRRMLDPRHATKIGRLEQALAHFGRRLVVSVETA